MTFTCANEMQNKQGNSGRVNMLPWKQKDGKLLTQPGKEREGFTEVDHEL